jgi:hypothetical protein
VYTGLNAIKDFREERCHILPHSHVRDDLFDCITFLISLWGPKLLSKLMVLAFATCGEKSGVFASGTTRSSHLHSRLKLLHNIHLKLGDAAKAISVGIGVMGCLL